jgi:hypothetical protein
MLLSFGGSPSSSATNGHAVTLSYGEEATPNEIIASTYNPGGRSDWKRFSIVLCGLLNGAAIQTCQDVPISSQYMYMYTSLTLTLIDRLVDFLGMSRN